MPKKRQPREIWQHTRKNVLERDKYRCVRCKKVITIRTGHVDHVVSGKRGGNQMSNLRTLCYRCHALRADPRHRGMIASALKKGVIPPDWRDLVWED